MDHLVWVAPQFGAQILSGIKTCESRISRIAHPARHVSPQDTLWFRSPGTDVYMVARVASVDHYRDLSTDDLVVLANLYWPYVDGPRKDCEYWTAKPDARYAHFIWLEKISRTHVPRHHLPTSQMGWIADVSLDNYAATCMPEVSQLPRSVSRWLSVLSAPELDLGDA